MATEEKNQAQQKQAGKQAGKQANKVQKTEEYRHFRDLTKEEIKKLPTVKVEMEKIEHPKYGESVQLLVHLTPEWKKQIRKAGMFDVRKYNLVVMRRSDLSPEKNHHVMQLPIRFLHRYDENGEIRYRRFEIAFTSKDIVSEFFDRTDDEMLMELNPGFEFIKDKDSTEELSISKAEETYAHFA